MYFCPTSQGPMSKLFRFSKSLGKSNGRKWSQVSKFLQIKGVRSPCIFFIYFYFIFFFFGQFCVKAGVFGIGATICIGREMLGLQYWGFFFELPISSGGGRHSGRQRIVSSNHRGKTQLMLRKTLLFEKTQILIFKIIFY